MRRTNEQVMIRRIRAVAEAPTEDLRKLLRLGNLRPSSDLRFHDWSDVSFRNEDLGGFDFTGARLLRCDFSGARIARARFDQAVIDFVGNDPFARTDLRSARDWKSCISTWKSSPLANDQHLRPGMVFQDAPFAPRMVMVPPGVLRRESKGARADITLSRAFAVGQFHVTSDEIQAFVGGMQADLFGDEATKHVDGRARMSWILARKFAIWLSATTGRRYRLLSESEWEYCTGIEQGAIVRADGNEKIGVPNSFGLHQMRVRSWEWCQDLWHNDLIDAPSDGSPYIDAKRRARDFPDYRTVRSGVAQVVRPLNAPREHHIRTSRNTYDRASFRVARDVGLLAVQRGDLDVLRKRALAKPIPPPPLTWRIVPPDKMKPKDLG